VEVAAALAAAGVRIRMTCVGSGSVACGMGVLADLRSPGSGVPPEQELTLLSDPGKLVFAALGCANGVRATLTATKAANTRGLWAFPWECCCRGRVPFLNAGDPWQQGGVFLLGGGGGGGGGNGVLAPLFALRETSPGFPALNEAELVAAVAAACAQAQAPAARRVLRS